MDDGVNQYYYHFDGLGSVTALSDSNGNLTEGYEYDIFGNITSSLSGVGNPYYFTGRRYDSETGLYYYRARYYSPNIGRFLQADPYTWGPNDERITESRLSISYFQDTRVVQKEITDLGYSSLPKTNDVLNEEILGEGTKDPRNLHRYIYCLNNPIIWTDPHGLWKEVITQRVDRTVGVLSSNPHSWSAPVDTYYYKDWSVTKQCVPDDYVLLEIKKWKWTKYDVFSFEILDVVDFVWGPGPSWET